MFDLNPFSFQFFRKMLNPKASEVQFHLCVKISAKILVVFKHFEYVRNLVFCFGERMKMGLVRLLDTVGNLELLNQLEVIYYHLINWYHFIEVPNLFFALVDNKSSFLGWCNQLSDNEVKFLFGFLYLLLLFWFQQFEFLAYRLLKLNPLSTDLSKNICQRKILHVVSLVWFGKRNVDKKQKIMDCL